MAFAVQHVHIKTNDPKETVQFYIDNFGATMKREVPGRGLLSCLSTPTAVTSLNDQPSGSFAQFSLISYL